MGNTTSDDIFVASLNTFFPRLKSTARLTRGLFFYIPPINRFTNNESHNSNGLK